MTAQLARMGEELEKVDQVMPARTAFDTAWNLSVGSLVEDAHDGPRAVSFNLARDQAYEAMSNTQYYNDIIENKTYEADSIHWLIEHKVRGHHGREKLTSFTPQVTFVSTRADPTKKEITLKGSAWKAGTSTPVSQYLDSKRVWDEELTRQEPKGLPTSSQAKQNSKVAFDSAWLSLTKGVHDQQDGVGVTSATHSRTSSGSGFGSKLKLVFGTKDSGPVWQEFNSLPVTWFRCAEIGALGKASDSNAGGDDPASTDAPDLSTGTGSQLPGE
ncbi:hypothetical protein BD324DRAFT_630861 [Kockovaella imperatae]|uniref:Uncharacterized protein n=1 Tax=Kockovaella imperatae TaxID=4999 RepID=A0A1Y1UC42_9TREE|nr:hypothetical protein BD324DRAFT_630861 [Kockovaella imperatae]ORX35618.1 hypothetical protein BD324DRAFT_630861 [Kockovaella imperatae]